MAQMKFPEHHLQKACVTWFDNQYRTRNDVFLFAIPNGGHRHVAVAAKLKAEGVRAGVPDLCLLSEGDTLPRIAFIEMKSDKGRLNDNQKHVTGLLTGIGINTYICRSLDEFMETIKQLIG